MFNKSNPFSLGAGFTLVLFLMFALTLVGLQQMSTINARLEQIVKGNNVKTELATVMRDSLRERVISMHTIVVLKDPIEQDSERLRFYSHGENFSIARRKLDQMVTSLEEKAVMERISKLTQITQPLVIHAIELAMARDASTFDELQLKTIPAQNKLLHELDNLLNLQRNESEIAAKEAELAYRNTRLLMLWLGMSALITGIGIAILATRRATRHTQEIERAAEVKSKFVANVSHEIRTPMNGILGMAALLLDTHLTPEQRDYAETVCISAESLLAIINDILDFSKIEAGKLDMETENFDLRVVIAEVAELLARQAQKKGIELIYDIPPEHDFHLRGAAGRLRQILTNLTANAVKFTDTGEVLIRVIPEQEEVDKIILRFEICDTGVGISEEGLQRLFQPFSQGEGSTIQRDGGTGLGLVISKQLATMMGGEIGVDSAPGHGSTFWVRLPVEKQPNRLTSAEPEVPLNGLQTLIASSNIHYRAILEQQLKFWNVSCVTVATGQEVLSQLQTTHGNNPRFNLLILDTNLPDYNAITLTKKIRGEYKQIPIRILLLTSISLRIHEKTILKSGIDAILTKPTRPNRLAAAMAGINQTAFKVVDSAPPPPTIKAISNPTARILVAEDNQVNRKLVLYILQKLNIAAEVAINGQQALEALSKSHYDLVLMDCQMPEMDGFETTTTIRSQELASQSKRVPIIAMTANAMQGDRERCLASGMDDYLRKPLKLEDMEETLQKWLPQMRRNLPKNAEEIPLVDFDRMLTTYNDRKIVEELLTLYLDTTPPLLNKLKIAIEAHDISSAKAAHEIKGASSCVNAASMATLSKEIEMAIKKGDWGKATEHFEQIETEFIRVLAYSHKKSLE